MSYFFTICIPIYNRSELLERLFNSLKRQSFKNFNIIIVDDASTEDIYSIIKKYKIFKINYTKLNKNQGRSFALKTAILKADGLYTIIMDSDDYFVDNILEHIHNKLIHISNNKNLAGICGLVQDKNLKIIGSKFPQNILKEGNLTAIRCEHNIKGDKKEIVLTQILKKNLYDIPYQERRLPTSYIWINISKKYNFSFDNTPYIFKEYLTDGLTKNNKKIKIDSPNSINMLYYEILLFKKFKSPTCKIKAAINYWRYFFHGAKYKKIPIYFYIYFPIGYLFYLKDKR